MYYIICVFSGTTKVRWYVPVTAVSYKMIFRELLFIHMLNCNLLPPEQELSIIYFST